MVYIVGIGPGNIKFLTIYAKEIVKKADIIIGGQRNLDFLNYNLEKNKEQIKMPIKSNLKQIVDYIEDKNNKEKTIVVVASGDPSVYGIAKYLNSYIKKQQIEIIPGISSIQYLFAKAKIDMNDLYLSSSHGKEPDLDYIFSHKKAAMVTDNKIGPVKICEEIMKRNLDKVIIIGENLSYDDEKVYKILPNEAKNLKNIGMSVIIILDRKLYL